MENRERIFINSILTNQFLFRLFLTAHYFLPPTKIAIGKLYITFSPSRRAAISLSNLDGIQVGGHPGEGDGLQRKLHFSRIAAIFLMT